MNDELGSRWRTAARDNRVDETLALLAEADGSRSRRSFSRFRVGVVLGARAPALHYAVYKRHMQMFQTLLGEVDTNALDRFVPWGAPRRHPPASERVRRGPPRAP